MTIREMKEAPARDEQAAANDIWLTTAELARRWKITQATLRSWRLKKTGPPFFKPTGERGMALYRLDDIIAWEETHMTGSDRAPRRAGES